MKSILLAFSLIRVPKLFVSLLLWPLIIGLIVSITQVSVSIAYFGLVTETPKEFQKRITTDDAGNKWLRQMIFGSDKALSQIQVCRWTTEQGVEKAPNQSCAPEALDIVILTDSPKTFDISEYEELLEGSTKKIHLCRNCKTDIIISQKADLISSDIYGLGALGVFMLLDTTSTLQNSHYVNARINAREKLEHIKKLRGTTYLHTPGLDTPINMSQATKTMMLILNTALITILTLWLALKGHRKVLDYFARNGALLPLVAACGKDTFYASLWIITMIRVSFFLLAVIPSTLFVFAKSVPDETLAVFVGSAPDFILWVLGMIASLSSLAIIASIAELKHRHSMVSFLYRYVPLILAFLGTGIWFYAIFQPGPGIQLLQKSIACIPVIGISPILVSPLFNLGSTTIAAHSLLASALVMLMLRLNSRWFAAHLEEI